MASDEYVNDRSNLGIVLDQNLKIKQSQMLKDFISDVAESINISSDAEFLSIEEIKNIGKALPKINDCNLKSRKVYLNELLVGSKLILPSLQIPERNPELEKRISQLRNTLAQKEYNRMTKDVDFTTRYKPEDAVSYQSRT